MKGGFVGTSEGPSYLWQPPVKRFVSRSAGLGVGCLESSRSWGVDVESMSYSHGAGRPEEVSVTLLVPTDE